MIQYEGVGKRRGGVRGGIKEFILFLHTKSFYTYRTCLLKIRLCNFLCEFLVIVLFD